MQILNLRTTPRGTRGAQDIRHAKLQVVVDKAISLLDGALFGGQAEDISVIVRNVRDMLFNARKEMSQEKVQEDMRKKIHDPIVTPYSAVRASSKDKAPPKEKAPPKCKGPSKEKAPGRAPPKRKGPAKKKAKI